MRPSSTIDISGRPVPVLVRLGQPAIPSRVSVAAGRVIAKRLCSRLGLARPSSVATGRRLRLSGDPQEIASKVMFFPPIARRRRRTLDALLDVSHPGAQLPFMAKEAPVTLDTCIDGEGRGHWCEVFPHAHSRLGATGIDLQGCARLEFGEEHHFRMMTSGTFAKHARTEKFS